MSVFIQVLLDNSQISSALGQQLVAVCPVNIFASNGAAIHVVQENQDECTLCELCLRLAPRGAVTINKLYKAETLSAYGESVS
jgi:ferredoxin